MSLLIFHDDSSMRIQNMIALLRGATEPGVQRQLSTISLTDSKHLLLLLEEGVLVVEVSASLVGDLGPCGPEDVLREPLVADLEPVLTSVQLVHLLGSQLESVELQVVLDTGRSNGL
jgi:hypothetical protein